MIDDYFNQALKLLPQGLIWAVNKTGRLAALLWMAAGHLSGCHKRADNLINEAIPLTAHELLPEWEQFAGLPDECSPLEDQAVAERQEAVALKLTGLGSLSVESFYNLARRLGYKVRIREYKPFTCGRSVCGGNDVLVERHTPFTTGLSRCGGPAHSSGKYARYYWKLTVYGGRRFWFRCGRNRTGEALGRQRPARDLECFFKRRKPAHTIIIFDYQEDL